MSNATALLNRLQQHQGAANGVTAEVLAVSLDTSKRHIRSLVSELRLEGIAVCGHPKTGYFIAATAAEIESTCKFLRSRAMHSLTLESRLRKVTLSDLLGQMRLKS
ncbi:MAG: hypothetical protein Q8R21_03170 [Burkholderiales bacterium]|nr:hypothetical protein [Burkholderiales bacterium]